MAIEQADASVIGHFYPYEPWRVWTVLNSRELFFADWGQEMRGHLLEVRRPFTFKVWPIPGTDFSGNIQMEYLEIRPHELLVFTLTVLGEHPWPLEGTLTLARQGQGTYVTYVLAGFTPGRFGHSLARRVVNGAHKTVLKRAEKILRRQYGGYRHVESTPA